MIDEKSRWCVEFLRKVRKEFYSMKSTNWYEYLVHATDSNFFKTDRSLPGSPQKNAELAEESRIKMAEFLSNFTHLNLPERAELGVAGRFHSTGGKVNLTIRRPWRKSIPVSELPYDPNSVESIWEKKVLCWVSSQFFLYWHACYSQCTILIGDASMMEHEISRMNFSERFIYSVGKMPEDIRSRYLSTDFSPRVEIADGKPRIIFHIFSPFGGIFRRVAGSESSRDEKINKIFRMLSRFGGIFQRGTGVKEMSIEEEKAIFPFNCGVHY